MIFVFDFHRPPKGVNSDLLGIVKTSLNGFCSSTKPHLLYEINRECHGKGANNSLSSRFHHLHQISVENGGLQPLQIGEADNAVCDNKPETLFEFYCWLLEMDVVRAVNLMYMDIGHTHGQMGRR